MGINCQPIITVICSSFRFRASTELKTHYYNLILKPDDVQVVIVNQKIKQITRVSLFLKLCWKGKASGRKKSSSLPHSRTNNSPWLFLRDRFQSPVYFHRTPVSQSHQTYRTKGHHTHLVPLSLLPFYHSNFWSFTVFNRLRETLCSSARRVASSSLQTSSMCTL